MEALLCAAGSAVNQDGRFGKWRWDVSRYPSDVPDIIQKAMDL